MMACMASSTDEGPADEEVPATDPWLVERYRADYRDLVRLAALVHGDRHAAEEAVQDAFVAVARARATPANVGAYLRSAVLNAARSQGRRRRAAGRHLRRLGPPPYAPAADADLGRADDTARVLAALAELATRQREVLVLRYYSELTEAEIAETLGISVGSVKTHAHRGLAALERRLEAP